MRPITKIIIWGSLVLPLLVLAETAAEEGLMQELRCGSTKEACLAYCYQPENQNRCLEAAVRHGVMSSNEAAIAQEMQQTEGPGGCKAEQCRAHCEERENMSACMDFALQNPKILNSIAEEEGINPEEMREEMEKVKKALAAGAQLPAGCSGRDCKELCARPTSKATAYECLAFGRAAGFIDVPEGIMTDEFLVRIMVDGIKDESGNIICRGEDCEKACSENPQVCMAAMERLGIDVMKMIPAKDKEEMMEGMAMMRQGLAFAPASAKQCIDEKLAAYGGLAALEGTDEQVMRVMMKVGRQMEGFMMGCMKGAFSNFGPPGGFPGGPGFGQPGMSEDMMDGMMGDDDYDDEESSEDESEDEEEFHGGFPGGGMPGGFPDGMPGLPQLPGGCQPGPNMMPCIIKYCAENWQKQDPICQMGPGGGIPAGIPQNQPAASVSIGSFLANIAETLLGFLFR